jgi:alpha-glucosidase
MLLLTLSGTPTLYYGDEIGMADVAIPADQVQDPRELREPGIGSAAIRCARRWHGTLRTNARLHQRAPVAAAPWRLDHAQRRGRDRTTRRRCWTLHRDLLLKLRRAHPALAIGGFG